MDRSSDIIRVALVGLSLAVVAQAEEEKSSQAHEPDRFLLEVRQVEEVTRGVTKQTATLFTLQTLVHPGSPVHLRTIQKGQGIHLEGKVGLAGKDGIELELTGSAMEEMKGNLPPGLKGPVFDSKEFKLSKKVTLGKPEVLGEVKDTNGVYRLVTYATLKIPGPEPEILKALQAHRR